ncbi:MAG: rod shape-determining protein MreD, partial [Rhodospirillales bacterium]
PSLMHRLDGLARNLTPFILSLALTLFSVVPLGVPEFDSIAPLWPLMAVYHWAIYRPSLMPAIAVFIIGLLQDILGGTTLGINALVFPAVYWAVLAQEKFFMGKSFAIVWLGFGIVGAGAFAATWCLASLTQGALLQPLPVLFQYLTTLACFPVLSWLFLHWQQAFLRSEA